MASENYSRADESEAERLDRNYGELLQELRVAQTGVQILFAFLLGIAFQNRFTSIQSYQRGIYLVTLLAAACAAIMLIAPVAIHRMLFRRHQKNELVLLTSRLAAGGLIFLAIAVLCAVLFVLDVVINLTLAIALTAVLGLLILSLWYALPWRLRRKHPSRDLDPSRDPAP
jgi:uncharacterized membrane-anchored protein